MKKYVFSDNNELVEDYYTCPSGTHKKILRERLINYYHPLCMMIAIKIYKRVKYNVDLDTLHSHAQLYLLDIIDNRFKLKYTDSGKVNSLCNYLCYKMYYLIIDEMRNQDHYRKKNRNKIHFVSLSEFNDINGKEIMFEDHQAQKSLDQIDTNDFWTYIQSLLTAREFVFLYYYFKLGYNMSEIGKLSKYSESRISQTLADAVQKLKYDFRFKEGRLKLLQKVS